MTFTTRIFRVVIYTTLSPQNTKLHTNAFGESAVAKQNYESRRHERVKPDTKTTKFHPNTKGYFDSSKALEHLLSSSWGRKS